MTQFVKSPLRESGLAVLGSVPWGTHFALGYKTPEDLIDAVSNYFLGGLAADESCLWIVEKKLVPHDAQQLLQKRIPRFDQHAAERRLEITRFDLEELSNLKFPSEAFFSELQFKTNFALAAGRAGLRLCVTTERPVPGFSTGREECNGAWDRFVSKRNVLVMFAIPLEHCGAEDVIDLTHVHRRSITLQKGKWGAVEALENRVGRTELAFFHPTTPLSEATLSVLTTREKLVLSEVLKGHSAKKTAQILGISPRTVEFHRANILQKLGVDSTLDLMRMAWAGATQSR